MQCTVCSKTGIQLSKVLKAKNTTKFDKNGCQILISDKNVIAVVKRVGSLYYLECKEDRSLGATIQSKERLWYRHLGHLGEHGLIELAKN